MRNAIDQVLFLLLEILLITAHRVVYFSGAKLYVLSHNRTTIDIWQIADIYLRHANRRYLALSRSSGLWPMAQLYAKMRMRTKKAPWNPRICGYK